MTRIILLFLVSFTAFSQSSRNLQVVYVANEGFLLSNGSKSVLIDALYNQGFGKYDPPADDLTNRIQNGKEPFDRIGLYLVTHNHGDHFYAPYVKEFLKRNKKSLFVSSPEAGNQCKDEGIPETQVKNISLELGSFIDTIFNDIPIKIYRLRHLMDTTGTRVYNYAYLINLNGIKILHPGDITFEWDKLLLEKFNLENERIDVLFIPYYDLSSTSVKFVKEVIRPQYIIAMHVPPKDIDEGSKNFLNVFPDGIIFKNPMEGRSLK